MKNIEDVKFDNDEKKKVAFYLTVEQRRRLRILAADKNCNLSQVLGYLVDEAFEAIDKNK